MGALNPMVLFKSWSEFKFAWYIQNKCSYASFSKLFRWKNENEQFSIASNIGTCTNESACMTAIQQLEKLRKIQENTFKMCLIVPKIVAKTRLWYHYNYSRELHSFLMSIHVIELLCKPFHSTPIFIFCLVHNTGHKDCWQQIFTKMIS